MRTYIKVWLPLLLYKFNRLVAYLTIFAAGTFGLFACWIGVLNRSILGGPIPFDSSLEHYFMRICFGFWGVMALYGSIGLLNKYTK